MAMVVVVVSTLLPFKMEPSESVALYSSQRVLRYLGYDQRAMSITRDSRYSLASAVEAQFVGNERDSILTGQSKLLRPNTRGHSVLGVVHLVHT